MTKSSQRQASERKTREAAQNQNRVRKFMVPVAGTAVVLQRNGTLSLPEVGPRFATPHFEQEAKRWLAGTDEFFFYTMRVDGRALIWDIENQETLFLCVDQTLLDFEARRYTCLLQSLVGDPVLHQTLLEKAGNHIQTSSDSASFTDEPIKGVELLSYPSHPIYGPFLVLRVSKEVLESQTIYGVLRLLDTLVENTDAIEQNWMNLRLAFDGYDEDPRGVRGSRNQDFFSIFGSLCSLVAWTRFPVRIPDMVWRSYDVARGNPVAQSCYHA